MRIGRNEPCPCGSGKKYKHCHAHRPDELPADLGPPGGQAVGSAPATARKNEKRRQCSGCRACCGPGLHINTPALVKPTGETCPHLCDLGCTLWGGPSMPEVCQGYMCNYLVEPVPLTVAERPDKVGAIFEHRSGQGTRLIECAPGGLFEILRNRFWGPLIKNHLNQGKSIKASFVDDQYCAETIHVQRLGDRLGCALPSCDENGDPILIALEPLHERQTYGAWFIKDQGFPFDARTLIEYLGDREAAVLAPSSTAEGAPQARFRITRRQTEFLKAVLPVACPAEVAALAR